MILLPVYVPVNTFDNDVCHSNVYDNESSSDQFKVIVVSSPPIAKTVTSDAVGCVVTISV